MSKPQELPTDPKELEAYLASLPEEEQRQWEAYALLVLATTEDSPRSFAAFYKLIHGNTIPNHQKRQIESIYEAKAEDKGSLLFAWRGSWKTTTISVTFVAYRIGKEPHRANLVIQANDDSADKVTKQIADIISNHPVWKQIFPHVVPDEKRGWGAGGYEVMRGDLDYGQWRGLNSARKDPTFMGLGIRSKSLIGKHPDGVLLMDDIHDEENTISDRERNNVILKVTDTIMPFIVEDMALPRGEKMITWTIAVGTPWTDDDAYYYLKSTGEFKFLSIPVMREIHADVVEETPNVEYINHLDLVGWYVLTWPERFDVERICVWRNRTGKRGFARMFELDLKKSKETGLKYFTYPAQMIDANWAFGGGCDYASVKDRLSKNNKNRDFFALAYGAQIPTGGAVIMDGVVGHRTQAGAMAEIEKAQGMFPNWGYTVVEGDGKAEEFITVMGLKPHLRIIPMMTRGKGKQVRQERQMAPWFEIGLIRISDADTPFLNMLRRAFDNYPDGNDDVRDGVYWYCRSIPHVLQLPATDEEIPAMHRKIKKANPLVDFGGL